MLVQKLDEAENSPAIQQEASMCLKHFVRTKEAVKLIDVDYIADIVNTAVKPENSKLKKILQQVLISMAKVKKYDERIRRRTRQTNCLNLALDLL